MSNISNFNFNNSSLKTIVVKDNPYFCVPDLRNILGIGQNSRLIQDLTKGFVKSEVLTNGGKQQIYFCSEKDLYKITLRSNSKIAEPFQDWVCGEVLPQLRKTGSYSIQPKKDILRYAINLCDTKTGRKIHISVIEFLKNHEYYRDGKVYNSCRMYDNFESWFLGNNSYTEKCINYFQFICSMRNLGFIKGQTPLGWDILVYRDIIKTREDVKLEKRAIKYIENCNNRNEVNEYNNDNKWIDDNKKKIETKTENIGKISININNNNIIRKS